MALTLLFTLGEELYGLEISAIQEIAEDPPLHYVPQAEGVLLGAINFQGQILSLIDLPQLLGLATEQLDHRRVVLTAEYESLALAVTSVRQIARLDLTLVQPPPATDGGDAVYGVLESDGATVKLLDLDEVIKQLRDLYQD